MSIYHFDNNTTLKSNKDQDAFILSDNKFIILNSCAGSGKTRCLILKIKHLIDKFKIKKSDLIICTYTKVMTNTLKFRINHHFDNNLKNTLIGTFHSICYQLIKPIMFDNQNPNYNSSDITSPEEILVYTYENIVNNNIDISSKYIIIDEYQDLSPMQQKIIYHLLAYGKIKGVYLIGDYNQSIYTYYNNQSINLWIEKINNLSIGSLKKPTNHEITNTKELLFKKLGIIDQTELTNSTNLTTDQTKPKIDQTKPKIDQTKPKIDQTKPKIDQTKPKIDLTTDQTNSTTDSFITLKLNQNFRSTKDIINLANCFIDETDKMISIYTYTKYKPKLIIFDKWTEEINYLCQTISNYVNKDRFKTLGTIAVLSRYNKTLEFIEDKLINMNIGYDTLPTLVGSFSLHLS
jgi:DNA helicase-2/ATP-dependent DNA helicase PcrA